MEESGENPLDWTPHTHESILTRTVNKLKELFAWPIFAWTREGTSYSEDDVFAPTPSTSSTPSIATKCKSMFSWILQSFRRNGSTFEQECSVSITTVRAKRPDGKRYRTKRITLYQQSSFSENIKDKVNSVMSSNYNVKNNNSSSTPNTSIPQFSFRPPPLQIKQRTPKAPTQSQLPNSDILNNSGTDTTAAQQTKKDDNAEEFTSSSSSSRTSSPTSAAAPSAINSATDTASLLYLSSNAGPLSPPLASSNHVNNNSATSADDNTYAPQREKSKQQHEQLLSEINCDAESEELIDAVNAVMLDSKIRQSAWSKPLNKACERTRKRRMKKLEDFFKKTGMSREDTAEYLLDLLEKTTGQRWEPALPTQEETDHRVLESIDNEILHKLADGLRDLQQEFKGSKRPKPTTTQHNEFIRMLSIFRISKRLSFGKAVKLYFEPRGIRVNSHQWAEAGKYKELFGPGRDVPNFFAEPRQQSFRVEPIADALEILIQPYLTVTFTAFGTREVQDPDTKEYTELNRLDRLVSIDECWTMYNVYLAQLVSGSKETREMLSKQQFEQLARIVAPARVVNSAAQDTNSLMHGRENFKRIKDLVKCLAQRNARNHAMLEGVLAAVDCAEYLLCRGSFTAHLTDDAHDRCACHSFNYCFADDATVHQQHTSTNSAADSDDEAHDEIDNNNPDRDWSKEEFDDKRVYDKICPECNVMVEMVAAIDEMFGNSSVNEDAVARARGDKETLKALRRYWDEILCGKFYSFAGHRARASWETNTMSKAINSLQLNQCMLVADWKMKLLAIKYKESMGEFFGKRGIPWFGVMIIRWKTEEEKELSNEQLMAAASEATYAPRKNNIIPIDDNFVCQFIDNILESDSCEDSFAVISVMEGVLRTIKQSIPSLDEFVLCSDSAGCFSSAELCCGLPLLWRTGIRCKAHYLCEAGNGKSQLDAHFAYARARIVKSVAMGLGENDVDDAASAVAALVRNGGIKNSNAAVIRICRQVQVEFAVDSKKLEGSSRFHSREYNYASQVLPVANKNSNGNDNQQSNDDDDEEECPDIPLISVSFKRLCFREPVPGLVLSKDYIVSCFKTGRLPGSTKVSFDLKSASPSESISEKSKSRIADIAAAKAEVVSTQSTPNDLTTTQTMSSTSSGNDRQRKGTASRSMMDSTYAQKVLDENKVVLAGKSSNQGISTPQPPSTITTSTTTSAKTVQDKNSNSKKLVRHTKSTCCANSRHSSLVFSPQAKHERSNRRESRRQKAINNKKAERERLIAKKREALEVSGLFECRKCKSRFQYRKCCDKHEAKCQGEKVLKGKEQMTSVMIEAVAARTSSVHQQVQRQALGDRYHEGTNPHQQAIAATTELELFQHYFPPGWGNMSYQTCIRARSAQQYRFVIEAYMYGVDFKAKISPIVAEKMMQCHGTPEGKTQFGTQYPFMNAVNVDNVATFFRHELLDQFQLRSYFGDTLANLKTKYKNANNKVPWPSDGFEVVEYSNNNTSSDNNSGGLSSNQSSSSSNKPSVTKSNSTKEVQLTNKRSRVNEEEETDAVPSQHSSILPGGKDHQIQEKEDGRRRSTRARRATSWMPDMVVTIDALMDEENPNSQDNNSDSDDYQDRRESLSFAATNHAMDDDNDDHTEDSPMTPPMKRKKGRGPSKPKAKSA